MPKLKRFLFFRLVALFPAKALNRNTCWKNVSVEVAYREILTKQTTQFMQINYKFGRYLLKHLISWKILLPEKVKISFNSSGKLCSGCSLKLFPKPTRYNRSIAPATSKQKEGIARFPLGRPTF